MELVAGVGGAGAAEVPDGDVLDGVGVGVVEDRGSAGFVDGPPGVPTGGAVAGWSMTMPDPKSTLGGESSAWTSPAKPKLSTRRMTAAPAIRRRFLLCMFRFFRVKMRRK